MSRSNTLLYGINILSMIHRNLHKLYNTVWCSMGYVATLNKYY